MTCSYAETDTGEGTLAISCGSTDADTWVNTVSVVNTGQVVLTLHVRFLRLCSVFYMYAGTWSASLEREYVLVGIHFERGLYPPLRLSYTLETERSFPRRIERRDAEAALDLAEDDEGDKQRAMGALERRVTLTPMNL